MCVFRCVNVLLVAPLSLILIKINENDGPVVLMYLGRFSWKFNTQQLIGLLPLLVSVLVQMGQFVPFVLPLFLSKLSFYLFLYLFIISMLQLACSWSCSSTCSCIFLFSVCVSSTLLRKQSRSVLRPLCLLRTRQQHSSLV